MTFGLHQFNNTIALICVLRGSCIGASGKMETWYKAQCRLVFDNILVLVNDVFKTNRLRRRSSSSILPSWFTLPTYRNRFSTITSPTSKAKACSHLSSYINRLMLFSPVIHTINFNHFYYLIYLTQSSSLIFMLA